ncbi:unnamed protein product [Soboliphyme baturini]|uniref:Uncharacterized protein n=1 Tax=Soboliphyme baturini TaxID=241478 RepID=A0A183IMK9_9BILA|nr:unnamed protein product [Soboliphyme baturini]
MPSFRPSFDASTSSQLTSRLFYSFLELLTKNVESICESAYASKREFLGIVVGYNFIRGCSDKVLVSGFNNSALETHRFQYLDVCRLLPRKQLMNQRGSTQAIIGDVHICGCFHNRCNKTGHTRPVMWLIVNCSLLIFILHCKVVL